MRLCGEAKCLSSSFLANIKNKDRKKNSSVRQNESLELSRILFADLTGCVFEKVLFDSKSASLSNRMTDYEKNLSENIKFFEKNHQLVNILRDLDVNIIKCSNRAKIVNDFAAVYDFDNVKHNGYRTCGEVLDAAIVKIDEKLISLGKDRSRWFFKPKSYIR